MGSPEGPNGVRAAGADQLRLITKVARLYHEQGLRQPQIAKDLSISQARVSRLLKQASELGIVRTTVIPPPGVYTEVEENLKERYGLLDAVVIADQGDSEQVLLPALGGTAAAYLDATLTGGDTIGLSTWSASLLATVDAMRPKSTSVASHVVQVVGGVGNQKVQFQATRLTSHLADLTRAEAVFMPAPAMFSNAEARETLMNEANVQQVMKHWRHLTVLLVGVGSLEPSSLLRESGNAIADQDQADLRDQGAVGDVCLNFFDADGVPVHSSLTERILSIEQHHIRAIPRRIAVAGGGRKAVAVRGALLGGWANVLITDLGVARHLLSGEEEDNATGESVLDLA